MTGASTRKYEFGGFWVDLAARRVYSGATTPVNLSARAFDVLLYLLEHRGEDVSKERLMNSVWPDTVVEDNNLNQAITALRRGLADTRSEPRFIMTVPGRGYRFVASVVEQIGEPESAPPPAPPVESRRARSWVKAAALTAGLALFASGAALIALKQWPRSGDDAAVDSLAVLPFRPLLHEQGNPALELGMVDALIGQISALPGMTVRPLSTVSVYTSDRQDPIEIGRRLGVAAVLEGTVQRQGDRVRVSSRLLRVSDGRSLWSDRFDEPMSGIFEVQDAISNRVMATLGAQLGTRPQPQRTHRPTVNVEAYQLYASGTFNRMRRDTDGTAAATRDFRAALELDPNYALAWAALSTVLSAQSAFGIQPAGVVFPEAQRAAQRAVELDAGLAEAQAAMGQILVQFQHEFVAGEQYYQRARQLNPNSGLVRFWTSLNYLYLGRAEESLVEARLAQELEPANLALSVNVARVLYYSRKYDAAITHTERLLTLVPTFDDARTILGRALLHTGRGAAALGQFEARVGPSPGSFGDIGRAYATAGRRVDAHAEIDRIRAKSLQGFGVSYDIAGIHALLGEFTAACEALATALHDHSPMIGTLRLDPDFDRMRDQPCFAEVARELYPP